MTNKTYVLLNDPMNQDESPIKSWTMGVPVEESALKQLKNIASLPIIHSHVAVMPDVHLGLGATIGSVIATKGAIIPAAVGVDLGCGMAAQKLGWKADKLPDSLSQLRSVIESKIPHGRTDNGGSNDRGSFGTIRVFDHEDEDIRNQATALELELKRIVAKHPQLGRSAQRAWRHSGTLGTGNHFVEVCLDENEDVWVMLHSGSRGIGNAIGTYFIEKAKEEMLRKGITLPDVELAYIQEGSPNYTDYLEAVSWAQRYAALNRTIMMKAALSALHEVTGLPISIDLSATNCHHNYVSEEYHFGDTVLVTRKGAVSAMNGQLGIIPGSMGAKSFIVRGKGNLESFCSCSHGAGRVHSRNQAKKLFTLTDHAKTTAGVECRKDESVLDETPQAYKNIEDVMAAQEELVEIIHTLKQVLCVKG